MKSNKKRIFSIIFITLLLITNLASSVFAITNPIIDTSKKGSISLTAYQYVNGNESNKKKLEGAEFTVYLVDSNIEDISSAERYITNNNGTKYVKTTNSDGLVEFENLELGRYYVVETNAPKNVFTKVESFLVDVPSINSNGTAWNYDVVVYPKNTTVYANVTISKTNDNTESMEGVEFKLQKQEKSVWKDYDLDTSLVTDENGQIKIQNLEVGKYRLIETSSLEGYIVDSSNTKEFEVKLNNTEFNINMINEKPKLKKYVLLSDKITYGKSLGVDLKDTASWKITATIPTIISKMKTYTITDELSKGLEIDKTSIKIYGIKAENRTLLESNDYSADIQKQVMTIKFDNENLSNYDELEILYDTSINENIEYGKANNNKVKMTYTDLINIDGEEESTYTTTPDTNSTAEVHTGKLLILKTDGTNALAGAIFKIASSKENAENGIFTTDKNGNDITATSDKNGHVVFRGLKYGNDDISAEQGITDYWVVEVQAPSYEENGETKYYNLLSKPVKVQINANSGEISSNTTKIVNKKGFILPKTGAVGSAILFLLGLGIISIILCVRKKDKNEKTHK